ncbi:MAG TPA: hypothetical protein VF868_09795 [Bacteroidia bacterium]|jgi:hypothetical protein
MKKYQNVIGFLTALLLFTTVMMKSNHLPWAGITMALSGISISMYLPFLILYGNDNRSAEKNAAMVASSISASVLSLGITFKFQHWSGAGIMIVLGLLAFAFIAVPLLLKQRLRSQGSERKTLMNTFGATGLTLFSLGLLFKIQHWPGAAVMLGLSLPFLFFGYFLLYMTDKTIGSDEKAVYLRKAFFSVIIGSVVATFILLDLSKPLHTNTDQASVEECR